MVKITNPEKQCKKTPESFSEESKIERVNKQDYRRGIILDSPEEFGQALIIYGSGSVQGAGDTKNHDLNAIGQDLGPMAVGVVLVSGVLTDSNSFSTRLAKEAISKLKSTGRFYKSHEYTFNNFEKTSITGMLIGGKYILELCAAYVGSEPEGKLAEVIKKPRALVCSSAKGLLSIVDGWWFNLNLENAVRKLPLPKKTLENVNQWTEYFASSEYTGKAPEFEFEYNGRKFALTIGLDVAKQLRPEGVDGSGREYLQARGKSIVGGAWTTWDGTGNNRIKPKKEQPSLVCSVSLPGEKYSRPIAITSEEIKAVQDARGYIAEKLSH